MKDPVCGMEVIEPPHIQMFWENQPYGFCNLGCLDKFKKDPKKYLNAGLVSMGQETEFEIKSFIPLLAVFSVILILSLGAEFYYKSWNLTRWMENFMAAFFIIFGGLKLLNWKGFVEAYQTYDLLAEKSSIYAYSYPFIELSLGTAYLFRWNSFVTNLVTVIVMWISSMGVARALLKKQKIQCACLGVLFRIPMTKVTLMEDLLMGFMAAAMLLLNHGV